MDIVTRLLLKTNDFDSKLNNSKYHVDKFNKEISSMAKTAGTAVAGLAGAFGLAMGASEAFGKTIDSSQTLTDAFGSATEQAKAGVNTFFSALSMGDFSGFTTNMQNAILLAKEYYAELDRLGSMEIFQDNSVMDIQNNIARDRNVIKNKNSTDEQRKAAQEDLKKQEQALKKLTVDYKQQAERTYITNLKAIVNQQGGSPMTDDDLLKTFGSFEEYKKITNRYIELQEKIAKGRTVSTSQSNIGTVSKITYSKEAQAIMDSQEYKIIRAISEAGDDVLKEAKAFERKALQAESILISAEGSVVKGLNSGGGMSFNAPKTEELSGSLNELSRKISEIQKEMNSIDVSLEPNKLRELQTKLTQLESRKRTILFVAKFVNKLEDVGISGPIPLDTKGTDTSNVKIPKLDFEDPFHDKIATANDYADALSSVGSALGSVGGAFENDPLAFVGNSMAQIGQMIMALQSLALAKGVTSVFDLPFPANLAAVGAVMGTILGIFASIPKFETGGVVGGSSFTGDNILARVNSGEMILNTGQQSNLFSMLNSSTRPVYSNQFDGDRDINVNVQSDVRLRGADMYLVLSNYLKKTGKKW